ncbi:MAG: hypothetical protein AAB515_03795 [Patescibacteria group bacterium]
MTPELNGERINSTLGPHANSLIASLPRTDSTYFTLGSLFANRVFVKESTNNKQDADSAIYYLGKAKVLCPNNAVIAAYIAIATAMRAKETGLFQFISGKMVENGHVAFVCMDSVRKANPENLAVQFLSASLFAEASAFFSDKKMFRLQSMSTFQSLHLQAIEGSNPTFFQDEVQAHILLSLALLEKKLDNRRESRALQCQYFEQIQIAYKETAAARFVERKKLACN